MSRRFELTLRQTVSDLQSALKHLEKGSYHDDTEPDEAMRLNQLQQTIYPIAHTILGALRGLEKSHRRHRGPR